MGLVARGTVYLGGIQFTCDPEVYERSWPKRASIHTGLQGAVTIQDFGRTMKDMTLRLQSGQQQLMEKAVVQLIDTIAATVGAVSTFTDWNGNSFTVWIEQFDANPTFVGTLHNYTLALHVVSITTLYGTAYSGG